MDKQDRRRAAYREIVTQDEDGQESRYTVRVSGAKAEIIHTWPVPWEDEHGQGDNTEQHTIELATADLKRLIAASQWCIEKSEAFEAAHPEERPTGPHSPESPNYGAFDEDL